MVYRLLFLLFFCGIVFLYCLTLLFPPPSTSCCRFYFDMELLSRHQHIIRSSTAKPVVGFPPSWFSLFVDLYLLKH